MNMSIISVKKHVKNLMLFQLAPVMNVDKKKNNNESFYRIDVP